MKSFRFKYSKLTWVLLVLVFFLSIGGIAWNIFNLTEYAFLGAFKITVYAIIAFLSAVILLVDVSMIVYGKYVIKNGYIYSYFGIIKTKCKIDEITEFAHFKKSDKLVAYFNNGTYTVIVISPENYEPFVLEVRKINREIIFRNKIEGEDTPE